MIYASASTLLKSLQIALIAGLFLLQNFTGFSQAKKSTFDSSFISFILNTKKKTTLNARISATISRPGKSQDYSPVSGGSWVHERNSSYTYANNGNLTQNLTVDAVTNQNIAKDRYVFDPFGNEIENTTEWWQNGTWVTQFGLKRNYTYNSNGNITEIIFQEWNAGVWENSTKAINSYNANGNRQETLGYTWMNNAWVISARETYNYTNNVISEVVFQNYNAGNWENDSRLINISWATPNMVTSGYTTQEWQNNSWVNTARENITRDANGGLVMFNEEFVNNTWQFLDRYSEVFDQKKNFIGLISEQWNNGNWELVFKEEHTLTYDAADNITQRIIRSNFGQTGGILKDRYKYVYGLFQTFTISGLKKEIPQEITANIYPNPAHHILHIEIPETAQPVKARLSDLTGKVILNKNFSPEEQKQLNLEKLKPGIYLLYLATEKGKTVQKVVKN